MKTKHIFFILFSLILGLTACKKAAETSEDVPAEEKTDHEGENRVSINAKQRETLGLQYTELKQRPLKRTLKANGMLDVPPQNMVTISAKFGGFVKSTDILPGSPVSRGQVLCTLEHPDFITMQQEYLENLGQLSFLEKEYKRQQKLADEQVNALKSLEKAEADYNVMLARTMGQAAKLKMLGVSIERLQKGEIQNSVSISSPISGFVMEMNANIGSHLSPSDKVFVLSDTRHLHAELSIFEGDLPQLQIGQQVKVWVSGETEPSAAKVHLIGHAIGADRSAKVHVHFDQENPKWTPGTYLRAEIETTSTDGWAISQEAVLDFEGKSYVFVEVEQADDQHQIYEMMEIEVNAHSEGFVGLAGKLDNLKGKKIVGQGSYGLLSKLKNTEDE